MDKYFSYLNNYVFSLLKDNEKLIILAGGYANKVLDKKSIENLARILPLEELRSKIAGMVLMPAQKIATILKTPASQVASVLGAYGSKDK